MGLQTLRYPTAEEVWDALREAVTPGPSTSVPLATAIGATLAQDISAPLDFPPFDRAVMDGFAVRAADFGSGTVRLRNLGVAQAGASAALQVSFGECARINTGAPIPEGADAVVIVENSREVSPDVVELSDAPRLGQHIELRASLLRRGARLAAAGARITPGAIATLAAAGVREPRIFRRPRVVILSTGDELIAGDQLPHAGQIFDSNSLALAEFARAAGAEVIESGCCQDESSALNSALTRGLRADLLCVTGGMSKGTHDLVPAALEQLGVSWLIDGLNLKPGKPTRIGRSPRGAWVAGLPGNPVSCVVCFLLFCRPILRGLQGLGAGPDPWLSGETQVSLSKNGARPMFHPATWRVGPKGQNLIYPVDWRGSGDPFGLLEANALLTRPAHASPAERGEQVRFLAFDLPR